MPEEPSYDADAAAREAAERSSRQQAALKEFTAAVRKKYGIELAEVGGRIIVTHTWASTSPTFRVLETNEFLRGRSENLNRLVSDINRSSARYRSEGCRLNLLINETCEPVENNPSLFNHTESISVDRQVLLDSAAVETIVSMAESGESFEPEQAANADPREVNTPEGRAHFTRKVVAQVKT